MEKRYFNPYIFIAIGVISVSTSAIFVKLAQAPSGVTAFYRLLFSAILLMPFVIRNHLLDFRKIKKGDYLSALLAGGLLAFHFILWFESLKYTSVASSTVMVTMQPLFAFLGTYIFFQEKLTKRKMFSAILAMVGSMIIGWGDFQNSGSAAYGDLMALIACVLITGYLLVGQAVRKRVPNLLYTLVIYTISTLILLIYVLIKGEALYPYSGEQWLYFLLLAVFPTLLGHSLFNWSLKWVSTNTISMAILFEPVGASLLSAMILKESLIWSQWVGGILVLIGLSLFSLPFKSTGSG